MRNEDEVLQKLNFLYDKALRERKQEYLSTGFMNCNFNNRHRLKKHGMVGFCQNPLVTMNERHGVAFCNEDAIACNCDFFENKHTEESVMKDLEEIMRTPSLCGQEYPKLAIMLWFLQKDHPEASRIYRAYGCLMNVFRAFCDFITLRWW